MKNTILRLVIAILGAMNLLLLQNLAAQTQTFTSSGTFTVPVGVTSITVQAWGGGGGGGGGNGKEGGGGGGAYSSSTFPVVPGTTYTVTVGGGGTPGNAGGTSSFSNVVIALGGSSGNGDDGNNGGSAAGSTGQIKFSGGDGGDAYTTLGAGGGGGGGEGASGSGDGNDGNDGSTGNTAGTTGGGAGGTGNPEGGDGGRGAHFDTDDSSSPDALPGTVPGGGGGGASSNGPSNSGNGANGQVIVTWALPSLSTQTFTSNGTFTVPAGVTAIQVQAWGGGGGGGTGDATNNSRGGGGGGAFASSSFAVTPGTTYSVLVGTGGAPGVSGGNSNFGANLVVAAGGGAGGTTTAGAGGSLAASIGQIEFAGGNGGTRNNDDGGGGGGGSAFTNAAGNNGQSNPPTPNGGTGGTGTGNGGDGGAIGAVGLNGNTPGGGGGGKGNGGANSGSGAAGQVIVSWEDAGSQQTFTSNGTFTVPAGVTSITVQAWGGGGAGRGGGGKEGGGGGGAFATRTIDVSPGQMFPVTIGLGGSTPGSPGLSSQFGTTNPALVIAVGGASGNGDGGAAGGAAGSCTPTVGAFSGGIGGTSSGGGNNGGGGGGGSATASGTGGTGGASSGNTGGTGGIGQGNGGNGGTGNDSGSAGNGQMGNAPGGGGGGKGNNGATSGAGANGQVIVFWIEPCQSLTPTIAITETSGLENNDGVLCDGGMATLDAGTYEEYEWSNGETTQTISVSASGTYTVLVTDDEGCTGTASVTITVHPNPVCTISGPVEVCLGETATYSVPDAGPGATYEWETDVAGGVEFFGPGSEPFEGIIIFGMPSPGHTTLTVHITDANGCESTCMFDVDVTAPACDISGPAQVCLGAEAEYSVPDAGTGATYDWETDQGNGVFFDPGSLPFEGTVYFGMPSPGQTTLTVHITGADGCESTCSIEVEVLPVPPCTIEGPMTVCENSDGHAYNGPVLTGVTYSWTVAGNAAIPGPSDQPSVVVDAEAEGSFTLMLLITGDNGCTSVCTKEVAVIAADAVSLTLGDDQCYFTGTTTLSGGMPPGGTYSGLGVSGTTFDATVAGVGVHTITYTMPGGCAAEDEMTVYDTELLLAVAGPPGPVPCNTVVPLQIVAVSGFTDIASLEFAVTWDPLQWVHVMSAPAPIPGMNTVVNNPGPGHITVTMSPDFGTTFQIPTEIVSLQLRSTGCGPLMPIPIEIVALDLVGTSPIQAATDEFEPVPVETLPLQIQQQPDMQPPNIQPLPPVSQEWIAGFNMDPVPPNTPQDPSVHPDITGIPMVMDNCTPMMPPPSFFDVLIGPSPSTCPVLWRLNRTWTATDNCGLQATYTQVIEFTDTTPPTITSCPPPQTIEWPAGFNMDPVPPNTPQDPSVDPAETGGSATATDNCGSPGISYQDELVGPNPSGCPGAPWTLTRTWTATDNCLLVSQCVQVISFSDNTPPAFTNCPSMTINLGCTPPTAALAIMHAGPATDNCGTPSISTNGGGSIEFAGCIYTQSWIVTATDNCGNSTNCVLTFVWKVDTEPPMFPNCPADPISIPCNPAAPPDAAAALAAAGAPTDNCGIMSVEAFPDDVATVGCVTTALWRVVATDMCGNTEVCLVTFTWTTDMEDPTFPGCPAAAVDLGCNPPAITEAQAVAAAGTPEDNCGIMSVTAAGGSVVSIGCMREHSWTVTVTDICGNVGHCTVNFVWKEDMADPEFPACPMTVADLGCNPLVPPGESAAILEAGGATDNCGMPAVTAFRDDVLIEGCRTSELWRVVATDMCMNTAVCFVGFTWVTDEEDPAFPDCPGTIDLGCNPENPVTEAQAIDDAGDPVDDCEIETITAVGGVVVEDGCDRTQVWTVTATDICDKEGTCEITYTWKVDTENPVIEGCPDMPIELDCNADPTEADALDELGDITDNCGDPMVAVVVDNNLVNCIYTRTFTITATDDCENEAECVVIFTWMEDQEDPEFDSCPEDFVELPCNSNPAQADALNLVGDITDNCGMPQVEVNVTNDAIGCTRLRTYTITATDDCDNEAECVVAYIWTADLEAPAFSACPAAPVNLDCNPALPTEAAAVAAAGAVTDNCAVASVDAVSGGIMGGGCLKTETWTVTALDDCNNDNTCMVTFSWIMDMQDPDFAACPAGPINLGCNPLVLPNAAAAIAAAGLVTDNCGVATVIAVSGGIAGGCVKTEVWTVTAFDDCGNDEICEITYTWTADLTDPVFTACPAVPVDLGCNPVSLPNAMTAATAAGMVTDNCNVASVGAVSGGIMGPDCMKSEVWTVTALDDCNNDATCTVTYTWQIADPVVLTCPPDAAEAACQTQMVIDAAFAAWLGTVSFSGGCNPVLSDDNTGAPPATGGSVTVTWTLESDCEDDVECSATFSVAPCISISGSLIWRGPDDLTGVGNAYVNLTGDATDTDGPTPGGPVMSGGGAYELNPGIPGDFVVRPEKNPTMFTFNGVNVADATAIQRHLAGLSVITDFFRLLAADVNKSKTVSTVDAALIRQGILGNPAALKILHATGDWRFIDTDYAYPDPAGPISLPDISVEEQRNLTGTTVSQINQNFWGVKMGDVFEGEGMGTADPDMKPDPFASPLVWQVHDRVLKSGETVDIDFAALNFTDLVAFQHGLRFDPAVLRYAGASGTGTDVHLDESANFGAYRADMGELRALWTESEGITLPDMQPVYRLRFKVLRGGLKLGEVLSLDPGVLTSAAYTSDFARREVLLVFVGAEETLSAGDNADPESSGSAALLQNRPNPFSDGTIIGFILPEACDAQLRVFDVSGRELWRSDRFYPAGYQEAVIRPGELNVSGLLYYELTTPFGTRTRKMMAVKK